MLTETAEYGLTAFLFQRNADFGAHLMILVNAIQSLILTAGISQLKSPSKLDKSPINMGNPTNKRVKRENFRTKRVQDGAIELPRKKLYRQRAHANPFSDHALE